MNMVTVLKAGIASAALLVLSLSVAEASIMYVFDDSSDPANGGGADRIATVAGAAIAHSYGPTSGSGPTIDKTRYVVKNAGHAWEIDIFHGDNEGLIVAEVELEDENEIVEIPDWVTKEITGDMKYYNSNLLDHPFSQ